MGYKLVNRKSPTDLDDNAAPLAPVLEFDYERSNLPGTDPWPEKHFGQTFGPSLVNKALKSGLYVLCSISQIPGVWAVSDARWYGKLRILEVLTLQGWRRPERLWTATTLKGLKL